MGSRGRRGWWVQPGTVDERHGQVRLSLRPVVRDTSRPPPLWVARSRSEGHLGTSVGWVEWWGERWRGRRGSRPSSGEARHAHRVEEWEKTLG
ncbi:hypothetical protein HZH66_006512 [Vespula vulgaris]|uniref:Uncharacterized protein n=1 Tax=Vespula vulgaris TaxID=7454 RepID=A0A834N7J0_VESVU|nr:hypothetical protein HZH66_006512 [Vespula vulgaris]